jgi:hypothetical protein
MRIEWTRSQLTPLRRKLDRLKIDVPFEEAVRETGHTSPRDLGSVGTGRCAARCHYTWLSNGFSRKIEDLIAGVALNHFAYNFIKIHSSLSMSPAMAAGVTTRLRDVADLVALLIESESKKAA